MKLFHKLVSLDFSLPRESLQGNIRIKKKVSNNVKYAVTEHTLNLPDCYTSFIKPPDFSDHVKYRICRVYLRQFIFTNLRKFIS